MTASDRVRYQLRIVIEERLEIAAQEMANGLGLDIEECRRLQRQHFEEHLPIETRMLLECGKLRIEH